MWVYRTVTQHRSNGIPSGKTHTVTLATLNGDNVAQTAGNEKAATEMMEKLAGRQKTKGGV